jgi:hypothetical protein
MTQIHFKRDKIRIDDFKETVELPTEYLKQIGKFIEKTNNPDNEFIQSDLRNINRSLKFLAGRNPDNDWEDPLKTETSLIKHCPCHWWKWTVRMHSR